MAEPADDWAPVAAAALPQEGVPPPQPSSTDDWQPVAANENTPPAAPQPMSRDRVQLHDALAALSAQRTRTPMQTIQPVLDAFGQGFHEGFDTGPTLSQDTKEAVRKAGLFEQGSPFEAATEMLAGVVAGGNPASGIQTAFRGLGGLMRGAAKVAERAGVPRDVLGIVAGEFPVMPGEFGPRPPDSPVEQVTPGQRALARFEAEGHETPPVPVADPGPVLPVIRQELQNGPQIVGYHGSSDVIASFDPNKTRLGRGLFFSENPDLASKFAEGLATDSDPARIFGEDDPAEIVKWVRGLAGDTEAKRIAKMMSKAGDIETDEASYREVNTELRKVSQLSDEHGGGGAPNITKVDLRLGRVHDVDLGGRFDWDKERDAINYARDNGFDSVRFINSGEKGDFFAVLNADQIGPPKWVSLNEARDLGVIGLPKPDVSGMAPAEAARAQVPPPPGEPSAAAATRTGDDVLRGPAPSEPEKAGNIRLDQIGINADAKDVILEAAKNNDDFNQARAGNVPLAQVESLSGASGVPSEVLSGNDGLGRLMHNDAVVRTWLQAFHQASDEIAGQMKVVAATGDEADIAKLRDMKLRFQHMQEQVSGLTAEAGRTLRVFRDFYESKGKAEALGKILEDNPGNDAGSLKKLADLGRGLDDPAQIARLLHDSNKPTFWDKYLYYWVNALISGPITHTKYIGANAAFGLYEAAVVTPVAGVLGAVRRGLGGEGGVYAGEAAARTWGLLAGTPDALKAAWTAARENMMTPFPNEVAGAAVNPLTQVRPNPIGGRLGFAIGIPGRSAAGIHSFFRWLGYRAEIEAQAYRAAAKEGLSPVADREAFWQRQAWHSANPSEEMMNAGIENGNHLTFIGEQGTFGRALSQFANTRMGPGGIQPFKLILPFTHIPGQILRASLEQTPAAFLDTKMRADLLGQNGAVAADTARARLVAGGVVSAMVANWAINDTITGYGPTDPTDRARWLRSHEPYSVRLGGWWYSYNKFGPIGDLMGLVANLVEVGPKTGEGEYAEAAGHVIKATSRILEDEVGMQGLVNLIDALDDPDRKMSRFVSGQAASNLPYSSLLRQASSFNDPYMREAKTFVDQLRYNTPWSRQDLLPKRDWLGQPMENPGYQNIIRQRVVNTDPIDIEVAQLRGFKPAPPQARIGGVALPPKMYDEYQAVAGGMTRAALEHVVTNPNWQQLPPGIREQTVHSMVESMRKTAGAIIQARHPELILQGMQDRQDKIQGVKPSKLTD